MVRSPGRHLTGQKLNAMSRAFWGELLSTLAEAQDDPEFVYSSFVVPVAASPWGVISLASAG